MQVLQWPISQAKGPAASYPITERSLLCTITGERGGKALICFQALSALPYRTMSVEGRSQDGIEEKSKAACPIGDGVNPPFLKGQEEEQGGPTIL